MRLYECPVRETADVIDGKWKPMIIHAPKGGTLRFGQLLREIPEASRKVLTDQLRDLQREHVISRISSLKKFERVEYSLTRYGRTLVPVLTVMAAWGKKHKTFKRKLSAKRA